MIQQPDNQIEQQLPVKLPSIKDTLLQPKILLPLVIVGAIFNIIFIGTTIYLANNRTVINQIPTIPVVQPTTAIQPTKGVTPTKTLSEAEACFEKCDDEAFMNQLKKTLKPIQYVKSTTSYFDYKKDTCYGEISIFDTPLKEYKSQFLPTNCLPGEQYKPNKITYRINNMSYHYDDINKIWETGTSNPRLQINYFDLIERLERQQDISSTIENNHRIIIGSSKTINDYNQSIITTIKLYVNDDFELVSYEITEGTNYTEIGTFYDFNIPNEVIAPK